ncbi:ParB N-terminal domain-containing protein [Brevundimonas sp. NPDC092305]|uniref:ParB/RepB/Spo0J family partition protein n=1 Tax=Brevundimonas sp. NPDC092305 TaxID=3363957 RepID=UPI00380C30BE
MTRTARASRPNAHASAPKPAPPVSIRRRETTARLGDIDIAPENLRAGEPADDQVPQLAATIRAAGLLQPPTARPGRKGEAPWMLLDGRRRLLALRLLRDAGEITDDHQVGLFVETDRARQAAAAVLTNTAAPVHVADIIAAIGRMLKARLGVAQICAALGYAEVEIRRLAALSALPPEALEALRIGRLTLKQTRLLARLSDRGEQTELALAALDGQGFPDWRLHERLDRDRVTATDARCRLVDPERYAAAGGRLEADLFGERPPVLLDPEVLTTAWMDRVRAVAEVFEGRGFTVHVSAGDAPERPVDLEAVGWGYGAGLTAEEALAWREARDAHSMAVEEIADLSSADEVSVRLTELVEARIARDQAAVGGRAVTTIVLTPSARTGLDIECWTPVEPSVEPDDDDEDGDAAAALVSQFSRPTSRSPVLTLPSPDVGSAGHALHALRTEVATRGLARALADRPDIALTALLARMFTSLVLEQHRSPEDAVLGVILKPFQPGGARVIESLDGDVLARLEERRLAWDASGLTVAAWLQGLDAEDRMRLLGELVAVTVDVREARTTGLRTPARAAAAELATLCAADITAHWTPDAAFLQAHGKTELVEMLEAMGAPDPGAHKLKKAELVARVEAAASARRWAPSGLDWALLLAGDDAPNADKVADGDDDCADPSDEGEGDDETGAFEVTPSGVAELQRPPT